MNRRVLAPVATAVVALAVGAGAGAAMWAGGDHGDDATASHDAHGDPMSMPTSAMDEQEFLRRMVPHHESAIIMAELARTKGRHPAVRRLADGIITAQEDEIIRMQGWHRSWYGRELVPRQDDVPHSLDMADLETAAGAASDRAFLRMMLAHHAGAIVMGEAVMMGSPREEVATLSERITAAQAEEIGQMQRWRDAWFPPLG